ncbi:MAG: alanine:cation symporter family protein [Phycisphaerae bacterium]|nr:alanine:cation symporter family protein [Phycisphaerae bacterium]
MPDVETQIGQWVAWLVGNIWSNPLFLLLLGAGLVFTVLTRFVQWRALTHGIACIRGHYDRPEDAGQINHFQALCAALSATIGLGNIAGVAVAISAGGPGAVFWMWVVGLLGMATKFITCSLAVMYRESRDVPDPSAPDLAEADAEAHSLEYRGESGSPEAPPAPQGRGEVRGGPMWYMQKGLVEPLRAKGSRGWVFFRVLAVLFAVFTALGALGSGNMFQSHEVAATLEQNFGVPPAACGLVLAILVAMVIIGGIKRIGQVAATLVPFMCIVYVLGSLFIIIRNYEGVLDVFFGIFHDAFTGTAAGGAFLGITIREAFVQGLRRACFSNEAGVGSAPIAHAAAKTNEPIREGVVAALGPFIDTLVICTMTALVILITNTWCRRPVATVTGIETPGSKAGAPVVQVAFDPNLPEQIKYVRGGLKVQIYLDGTDGDMQTALIKAINDEECERYEQVENPRTGELRLDVSRSELPDVLGRVKVGQPVHLLLEGAELSTLAYDRGVSGFGTYVVLIGICCFAFSTMISWSYYGEKGAEFLFGPRAILPYKFLFVAMIVVGTLSERFAPIYDFSDAMFGMMVFCNLPAALVLMPRVLRAARDYFGRLDRGEMPRNR